VSFPAAQAARLGGCTRSQLGHWRRGGVVTPSDTDGRYGFRDLVALRVVVSLLEAGLPMVRVRAALEVLRAAGGESGDELAGLRIVTDGSSVFACYDDGQILDALRNGQLALFVAVDRFAAALDADVAAFAAEREAFLTQLRRGSQAADPDAPDVSAASDVSAVSVASDADDDERVVGRPDVTGLGLAR
jgi:DNA-binding transcriptional MerR regulator